MLCCTLVLFARSIKSKKIIFLLFVVMFVQFFLLFFCSWLYNRPYLFFLSFPQHSTPAGLSLIPGSPGATYITSLRDFYLPAVPYGTNSYSLISPNSDLLL